MGAAGSWSEILTFTITDETPQQFRIGLVAGTQSATDGRWDSTGFRITADGGSTYATVTGLENNNGAGTYGYPNWVFFDVDLEGATSGTFASEGQQRLATQGPSLTGVTFDVPVTGVTKVGEDTTTDANWRTAAALEDDNEYGTDGYVIWGIDDSDSQFRNPYTFNADQSVLPAGISVYTDTAQLWTGTGNFGTMQDPGNSNTMTSVPLLVDTTTGVTTFTITRAAAISFRLTLLVSSGDDHNASWTNTVDDGTCTVESSSTHTTNGLHYHVFDVASGTNDVVISADSGAENYSLTGVAFDNVVAESNAGAQIELSPTELSLELYGSSATGTVVATYHAGTLSSNDVAIVSLVASNGFSASLIPDLGRANLTEEIAVTFTNSVGLEEGESTTSTLEVLWTEDGSGVTNCSRVQLDVTCMNEPIVVEDWSRCMTIGFDGYAGSETLTDFPVLIELNPDDLWGFSYADFASGSGVDLRFIEEDSTTALAYEIESWDTNGTSKVWVRVPELTADTEITVLWGNPDKTNAWTGAGSVWADDFAGVWHLNETTADSTVHANDATATGTETVDGTIAGGRSLDGDDYLDCGNGTSLNPAGNTLTLSGWIKPENTGSGMVVVGKSYAEAHTSPYYNWVLYVLNTGSIHFRLGTSTLSSGTITYDSWQHVAAVYDGSTMRIYLNGVDTGGSTTRTADLTVTDRNVRIGGRHTSSMAEYYTGDLDEIRVSSGAHSDDWILAEVQNVQDNASFCTYGLVQYTDPELPYVYNGSGVTNLLGDAATLTGSLMSTGGAPTTVFACWGESDGGTNMSAWAQSANLGILDLGDFSTQVSDLTSDTDYVYRLAASNEYGTVWSGLQSFTPTFPTLSVDPVQIAEGDSGTTLATFTVRLSFAYPEAVNFTFSTSDGMAGSADYDAQGDTYTFLAGETEKQISISIYGDEDDEGDEDFYLNILSADGAVIEDSIVRCVIFSDDRDDYLSPSDLVADADNDLLYVVESTASRIGIVSLEDYTRVDSIDLPQDPTGVALSSDGSTLYVTAGISDGAVYVVDTASRMVTQTISVGHSPREPVLTSSEDTLYVCERFQNTVAVVDLTAGSVSNRIDVVREPHGAALTPDGATLIVANLLPHQPSLEYGVAASVSLIDTASGTVSTNIVLPPGSHSLRDVAISPDGSYAVVAHTLGRFRVTPSQFLRGWANTSAMSIIDVSSGMLYNTVDIDDLDEGAANPWGMAFTDDGETLCIAHAGTHELSAIDWTDLLSELSSETDMVCDDISYLAGMRRRLPLPGNGPRGLAIVGTKVYTANYFSDSLAVADVTEGQEYTAQEIVIGWEKPQTDVRLGNQYFHDATLSAAQWQSCSSCHPDVRADGLNWDELNDGFGNPKNVKSLLYTHYTWPTTVTGVRANAETSVLAGLLYSHYRKVHYDENLYIDEFLKAEDSVPSPYLVDGELSEAAQRGQVLFEARCATCHSGSYLTDQELHDVGTETDIEAGPFDTPSLLEAWRTAPYLHDGRAQTLEDVVEVFHSSSASGLSDEQIDDLVEYVNSL
jgi:YVTN family beta-propeller protein